MTMTNRFEDFFRDDPWEGIKAGAYPISARRLYMEDDRFWVSVNDNGNPLFYVEENSSFEFEALNRLNCLRIQFAQLENGTRLICELTEADMFDKFRTISKDVAAYSSPYQGKELFSQVVSRIYSWSDFLKPSREGVGFRKLLGFWGELLIFYNEFVSVRGFDDSLKAWVGPENKKQDFTFDNQSFELKTLFVGDSNRINISSIEQLQRVTESLYLVVLQANESLNGLGYTVENLVERCLEKVKNDEALETKFWHKIASTFGKLSEEELNREFMDVNLLVYSVTDEFPRLTPDNSPHKGIINAKYTIDGNSLDSFRESSSLRDLVSWTN
jgi:hypothetical protein